ncbi:OsmC family protein [Spirosoma arcticum]
MKQHRYRIKTKWTGNNGTGTADFKTYSRNHRLTGAGKAMPIEGSSDPSFRGDATRYNPEELFVSSLSACHMLWYLHLCAVNGIVVTDYADQATGVMEEATNGSGQFREVTLHPVVTITDERLTERANALHAEAHRMCFIANSCNFPIKHQPSIRLE